MKTLFICLLNMYIICILLFKMIHSAQGMTEGNNLHLMSSTFQLEELLRKEVQLVQELNEYLLLSASFALRALIGIVSRGAEAEESV